MRLTLENFHRKNTIFPINSTNSAETFLLDRLSNVVLPHKKCGKCGNEDRSGMLVKDFIVNYSNFSNYSLYKIKTNSGYFFKINVDFVSKLI